MINTNENATPSNDAVLARAAVIAKLNDEFRCGMGAGRTWITRGIQTLSENSVCHALDAVRSFSRFDENNDPYHEHDFGSFEINGTKCFWKIDYLDRSLEHASEDPADPDVTVRVLTIMLAREY